MAPGADIGGAANRQIADGMSLRSARGAQVKDLPSKGAGTSATSQKTEAPVLTARERLRMHVNRNLALQQTSNSDKGPASAGGPPAAPRGASPANSNTPPPTAHQGMASKRGLGPITDTRLGKRGLSPDDTSPASSPGVDQVALNVSIDMAPNSPIESGTETSSSAFEDTETPPFIPSSEWGESTALGEGALGESQLSYYSEDGVRDGPAGVVDDEWVQGLYDMEGMS